MLNTLNYKFYMQSTFMYIYLINLNYTKINESAQEIIKITRVQVLLNFTNVYEKIIDRLPDKT